MPLVHRFRYLNEAPLNDTHFDLAVNFLEYWEIKPTGKTQRFSWVTDISIATDKLIEPDARRPSTVEN